MKFKADRREGAPFLHPHHTPFPISKPLDGPPPSAWVIVYGVAAALLWALVAALVYLA